MYIYIYIIFSNNKRIRLEISIKIKPVNSHIYGNLKAYLYTIQRSKKNCHEN